MKHEAGDPLAPKATPVATDRAAEQAWTLQALRRPQFLGSDIDAHSTPDMRGAAMAWAS